MASDPSKVDWTNLQAVILYAQQLADESRLGQTVILRPMAANFNIIHTLREDALLRDARVLFRAKPDCV